MAESEWLTEKRELGAAATGVLNKALDECLDRADAALARGDNEGAARHTILALIASDRDSRKGVVDCIEAGLDEFVGAWAALAPSVADGRLTQEQANEQIKDGVERVIAYAISHVSWPGMLTSEEVHMLASLADWLLED